MDDMKRLIEKYKQELMEYSRAAAPKENLEFPEMIGEDEAVQTMSGMEAPIAVREAPPEPPVAPSEQEECLNCEGEPIPAAELPAPQPEPAPPEQDNEELTPVDIRCTVAVRSAEEQRTVPKAPDAQPEPAESAPSAPEKPARKPEIIGYVDDDGGFDYNSIFGDMLSEPRVADRRVSAEGPRYDELPSQRENAEANTVASVRGGEDLKHSGEVSGVTDNSPREPRPERTPAGSVTPKQAERLNERPINSRPNEQLTGRSFENDETPANSRSDIRPLHDGAAPADRPQGSPAYSDLQNFVPTDEFDGNDAQGGNFRFRIYTARDALPIEGASCVIKRRKNGENVTMYSLVTDVSGLTEPVALPAPPASLSQSPENTVQPYALYDAQVSAKGFNTVEIKNIPVFEGVLSVQRVAMIPQAEESVTEIIDEQETDMNGGK